MDERRRLTVPAEMPFEPGDRFDVGFDEDGGSIVFRRRRPREDWVEILKACPVPMDDLPPRRRAPFRSRV